MVRSFKRTVGLSHGLSQAYYVLSLESWRRTVSMCGALSLEFMVELCTLLLPSLLNDVSIVTTMSLFYTHFLDLAILHEVHYLAT